jgi:hypothetical protein
LLDGAANVRFRHDVVKSCIQVHCDECHEMRELPPGVKNWPKKSGRFTCGCCYWNKVQGCVTCETASNGDGVLGEQLVRQQEWHSQNGASQSKRQKISPIGVSIPAAHSLHNTGARVMTPSVHSEAASAAAANGNPGTSSDSNRIQIASTQWQILSPTECPITTELAPLKELAKMANSMICEILGSSSVRAGGGRGKRSKKMARDNRHPLLHASSGDIIGGDEEQQKCKTTGNLNALTMEPYGVDGAHNSYAAAQVRMVAQDRPAAPLLSSGRGGKPSKRSDKGKACHCAKSRCLKLYCDCFSAGRLCGARCSCQKCANNADPASANERNEAIRRLKDKKGAWAFRGTSLEDKQVFVTKLGCRCKKSKCLKKVPRISTSMSQAYIQNIAALAALAALAVPHAHTCCRPFAFLSSTASASMQALYAAIAADVPTAVTEKRSPPTTHSETSLLSWRRRDQRPQGLPAPTRRTPVLEFDVRRQLNRVGHGTIAN